MKNKKQGGKLNNPRDFATIAKTLGCSVLTVQNHYNSAMRKIRHYLLKRKDKREQLQESLRDLANEGAYSLSEGLKIKDKNDESF